MKIAIVGSRKFPNLKLVENLGENLAGWGDLLVISGGAWGVDRTIEEKCKEWNIKFKCFPANWYANDGTLNKLAGFERNTLIANECEFGICFWDGASKGCIDTIRKIKKQNKDYIIIAPDGSLVSVQIKQKINMEFLNKVVLQKDLQDAPQLNTNL